MSSPAPSSSASPIPKKRRLWPWAMALALLAAGGWYASQRGEPPGGEGNGHGNGKSAAGRPGGPGGRGDRPTPVTLATIGTADIRVQVPAIGTVVPRNQVTVRARVDGPLLEVAFTEGKPVAAGEVLARIDPEPFKAALAQARGQLARDAALLKNAQIDLDRYKGLLAQDSIAKQQVDTQAALVRQYEGVVAADKAQVDAARLQLDYTRVTAPIGGRLGLRQADRGNVVGPADANGIVTINLVQPIDAAFAVPEAHLAQINQRLHQGAELPVELWDREQKQRLARGRLGAVDNAIDPSTGTIKAKAAFANEDGGLFPNQFVNVRLQLNLLPNALTVPGTAVQNNHVYLVQPDGTVTQRRVRVGVTDGDRVSVDGDLKDGDQVVTDGIDRLREGTKVGVIEAAAVAR